MNTQVLGRQGVVRGAAVPAAPRDEAPALPAPAALRRRLVLLALVCALPPWAVVSMVVGSSTRAPETAPQAVPAPAQVIAVAPQALEAPASVSEAVAPADPAPPARRLPAAAGALGLGSLAAALWLLRGLVRDVDAVTHDAAAGRRAARLLAVRTRERDRAVRDKADLTREAQRDTLTQLANRGAFLRRVDGLLDRSRDAGGAFTVFYIDLDDFKAVNDRHGHGVGDALLSAFATRLAGEVRSGDLAARLGGDEFAVLIEGLGAAEAEPIAAALVQCLSRPYGLGDQVLQVTASIGIASYPAHGGTAAGLLQAADAAMYEAKGAGRGGFRRSAWPDLGAPAPGRPGAPAAPSVRTR